MATPNDERIRTLSEGESEKLLGKETFRARVIEIINEEVGKVDFMTKIRNYASIEFDERLFRRTKYWITVILTALITSAIGFAVAYFFKQ